MAQVLGMCDDYPRSLWSETALWIFLFTCVNDCKPKGTFPTVEVKIFVEMEFKGMFH